MKRTFFLGLTALGLACGPQPEPVAIAPDYAGWSWCPEVEPSVAPDDDELWLQTGTAALYCAQPDKHLASIDEVLDARAQLRLVPGDLAIPLTSGVHPLRLQTCERGYADATALGTAGTATVEVTDILGRDRIEILIEQPLEGERTLQLFIAGWREALAPGVLLDGVRRGFNAEPHIAMQLCHGPCVSEDEEDPFVHTVAYDACSFPDIPRERHTLVAEDNTIVEFSLRNARDRNSLYAVIESAEGNIAGVPFQQTSFFDLAIRAPWNGARDYLVRLPEPIADGFNGDICGLRVEEAYPYDGATWGSRVVKLRCDGFERTSTVIDSSWSIEEIEESTPSP